MFENGNGTIKFKNEVDSLFTIFILSGNEITYVSHDTIVQCVNIGMYPMLKSFRLFQIGNQNFA